MGAQGGQGWPWRLPNVRASVGGERQAAAQAEPRAQGSCPRRLFPSVRPLRPPGPSLRLAGEQGGQISQPTCPLATCRRPSRWKGSHPRGAPEGGTCTLRRRTGPHRDAERGQWPLCSEPLSTVRCSQPASAAPQGLRSSQRTALSFHGRPRRRARGQVPGGSLLSRDHETPLACSGVQGRRCLSCCRGIRRGPGSIHREAGTWGHRPLPACAHNGFPGWLDLLWA